MWLPPRRPAPSTFDEKFTLMFTFPVLLICIPLHALPDRQLVKLLPVLSLSVLRVIVLAGSPAEPKETFVSTLHDMLEVIVRVTSLGTSPVTCLGIVTLGILLNS